MTSSFERMMISQQICIPKKEVAPRTFERPQGKGRMITIGDYVRTRQHEKHLLFLARNQATQRGKRSAPPPSSKQVDEELGANFLGKRTAGKCSSWRMVLRRERRTNLNFKSESQELCSGSMRHCSSSINRCVPSFSKHPHLTSRFILNAKNLGSKFGSCKFILWRWVLPSIPRIYFRNSS